METLGMDERRVAGTQGAGQGTHGVLCLITAGSRVPITPGLGHTQWHWQGCDLLQ